MKKTLVIGSRGSKLALWQARWIQTLILRFYPQVQPEIEIIKTSGDVKTEPLSVIGGKGVFTKELEDALLTGRIDVAVHSLKDLPTNLPTELTISAICEREDARDALVLRDGQTLRSVSDLQPGAVVGTSSPRRLAQLKFLRRDLVCKELRGNVDTRVRKLDDRQYDGLVLAAAGLRRLGLDGRISALIRTEEMLPAVGQGALAVETRINDPSTIEIVSALNHAPTEVACLSERAFLRTLGGGCQLPIAAYAVASQNQLNLEGLIADPGGQNVVRGKIAGSTSETEDLGSRLAEQLLKRGGDKLLAAQK
ncbi:MAG TPA: hydroxymethylbilane synthase [Pyrinomonadaceae bacterium]|nr:hydroxymethylbilane synthase [Pyrinomonadaceae bacterium]